jgi:hypothetical protein
MKRYEEIVIAISQLVKSPEAATTTSLALKNRGK